MTGAYCATFVGLGLVFTALGPTLLVLSAQTGGTTTQMSYLFPSRGVGYDYVPGNILAIVATIGASVVVSCVPLVKAVWGLALCWFFTGFFCGSIDTGMNTLIVWLWRENVNSFMQLLHFAFGLGAFLSPLIIAQLQQHPLWVQYLCLSVPFIMTVIPHSFLKSPPPVKIEEPKPSIEMQALGMENSAESSAILTESTEIDILQDENAEPGDTEAKTGIIRSHDEKRLSLEVIIAVALFLFMYVGAEIGYGGWIFTYAKTELDFSDAAAAYITAAFWGAFTFARFAGVFAAVLLTPRTMILSDMVGCAISLTILMVFPKSEPMLWLGSILLGVSLASIYPTAISLPQNFNVIVDGKSTSWMVVGASAGEMTVPLLVGLLQDKWGMVVLMYGSSAVLGIATIIYISITLRVKYVRSRSTLQRSNSTSDTSDTSDNQDLE